MAIPAGIDGNAPVIARHQIDIQAPLETFCRLGLLAGYAVLSGLQAALGLPGALIAVIAMVVSGVPAAGFSIAAPLLASSWTVIGPALPPSAALSAARGVVYLGGANLTGPLAVPAVYAAAGTVLTVASTAWRRHRPRAPQHAAQATGTAADASLAS